MRKIVNEMNDRLQSVINELSSKTKLQDEINIIKTIFQSSSTLLIRTGKQEGKKGKYYYCPENNPDRIIQRELSLPLAGSSMDDPRYEDIHITVSMDKRDQFIIFLNEHHGLVINQPASNYGGTLLCACAEMGKTELVRWLIEEQDANINLAYDGISPLLCAVQNARAGTLEYLLSKGAGPIEGHLIEEARRLYKLNPNVEDFNRCVVILERLSKQRAEDERRSKVIMANPYSYPNAIDIKISADLPASTVVQPNAPDPESESTTPPSAPLASSAVQNSVPADEEEPEPGSLEYELALLPKYKSTVAASASAKKGPVTAVSKLQPQFA